MAEPGSIIGIMPHGIRPKSGLSMLPLTVLLCLIIAACVRRLTAAEADVIQYHAIRTDVEGRLIPWFSDDFGTAFDHAIRVTWDFWDRMEADRNGLPYHMNHQVWRPDLDDHRGIGGDQIPMALSSWSLLFRYLGNVTTDTGTGYPTRWGRVVENMRFMADYYLYHGLSEPTDAWSDIPYPYNTAVYSGFYDGDMVLGKGYTQPDKAGSLGYELVTLFKITGHTDYLDAAIRIADTLARHTVAGDADRSPLPFKVHAVTGRLGQLRGDDGVVTESAYTSNWSGTLRLFEELTALSRDGTGAFDRLHGHDDPDRFSSERVARYGRAFDLILAWMREQPLRTNKWGPFFEDVPGWSDTQINAVTFAEFIMDHRKLFPEWRREVRGILDWVYRELGNTTWEQYGVVVVDEQTAYRVPGNSHSSRQAAAELHYAALTGDESQKDNAIRQLAWATYTVADDGLNRYFRDDIWMTDGYGDYVRHYLRAMAVAPELAPANQDHILNSTSIVSQLRYEPERITYRTFDADSTETIRLTWKPSSVVVGSDPGTVLPQVEDPAGGPGWTWQSIGDTGGLLKVRHGGRAPVTVAR